MATFDFTQTVFPLIGQENSLTGENRANYLGTCFFVKLGNIPVIATARHVLKGQENSQRKLFIPKRYGSKEIVQIRGAFINHKSADIVFCIPLKDFFIEMGYNPKPLSVFERDLELGTDVFTVAYPDTANLFDDTLKIPIVEINCTVFKGYVSCIDDLSAYGGSINSYILNFPSADGVSGAPLMVLKENEVMCAGYILGERRTDQLIDEKEVRTNDNTKTYYIYKSISRAYAMNSRMLLDARDLLENAFKEIQKESK